MALNYEMTFGVSEVARIFSTEREIVKTWAYHFSEYLKPAANPTKGTPRTFCVDDLRVLAYVYYHWEDDPDLEAIKIGLNTESHFEEPFNDIATQFTPLFYDPPEELDETWRHGRLIITWGDIEDIFTLAESYKRAGDMLIQAALDQNESVELAYPAIYNYRHATELYLKAALVDPPKCHELGPLYQKFKAELDAEFNVTPPEWFENIILVFDDFDSRSTTFRYGSFTNVKQAEAWADLPHIKTLMSWLAEAFQQIRLRRRLKSPGHFP